MGFEAVVARTLQILLALGGAYLVALWFVLVVWTYRDIEARSRNVLTQIFSTLLVVLFWVPGVLLYLILRPKETLDGAYQRSLEEEYLLQDLEELPLCPSCERFVEDEFVLCPHCHTRLREPCLACAHLIDLRWSICPYCGAAQGGEAVGKPERVEEMAARWRAPAGIRRPAIERPAALSAGPEREEAAEAGESREDDAVAQARSVELSASAPDLDVASGGTTASAADGERPDEARELREPIPLVPVPRGRFRRVGGERPVAANGDRERSGGEAPASAGGPFTSILGSRTQENGRSGPGGARARRAARQAERLSTADSSPNGRRPADDASRADDRLARFNPSDESGESTAAGGPAEAEAVSVRAEGKGD